MDQNTDNKWFTCTGQNAHGIKKDVHISVLKNTFLIYDGDSDIGNATCLHLNILQVVKG